MGIEEKAKAYDHALEVLHKYDGASIMFTQDLKEEMFPELKESGDERILNLIYCVIRDTPEVGKVLNANGVSVAETLSYLERQKEQKPIISDNAIREGVAHFGITQYQINNWLKKHINIVKQQPAEWSEEDRRILKGIIGLIDHDQHYGVSNKEMIDWLKSLRPQPKEEWSEEDEVEIKALDSIIRYIVEVIDKRVLEGFGTNYEELFSWLESLRGRLKPSSNWKPTEEQMRCLLDCVLKENGKQYLDGCDKHRILKSLFNELQKLIDWDDIDVD